MKKICLLLALIICLVPVLTSCDGILVGLTGGSAGAESVAKEYIDAIYKDFDKNALFEISARYNKELLKSKLSEEDFESHTYEGWREAIEMHIKKHRTYAADAAEYDVKYKVYSSRTVSKDSDEFGVITGNTVFRETEMEDAVEELALVRVVGEQNYVNSSDEERTVTFYEELLCLKIDGKWYVYGNVSYDTHYAKNDKDKNMEEWLD